MALSLFPRNDRFFDLFDQSAARIAEGAAAFQALLKEPARFRENARLVKDIEHRADKITHRALEMLYSSYITPIDREDIHALVTRLDDVVDYIDACAQRFVMFKIERVPHELHSQAGVLVQMTEQLGQAIRALRDLKRIPAIKDCLIELSRLENEGDVIFRQVLVRLIEEEKDPVRLIVMKELFEIAEAALDQCASVGHVIEAIVLKHG